MAFFTKTSPLLLLTKSKHYDLNRAIILSQIAKFSSTSYFNSALFINNSGHRNKCGFRSNRSRTLCHQIFLPHLSALSFMSTGSYSDNVQKVTTFGQGSSLTSSTDIKLPDADQVIFTNTTIPDSGREIIDPIVSELTTDLPSVVSAAEPTLSSLGLGSSYTPVGLLQQLLEYLHISGGLPWWLSIVVVTCIARACMMPVFIKTQRNAANLANYMPRLHYYQTKFNDSRKSGNILESSRIANEMTAYMKEHNINPMKNVLWPLIQAPVFLSFFWALRNMTKLPVESMKVGGFSWITDLTIPDPYYITPLLASATLYVILKVGAESGIRMDSMKMARYVVMAIPVIIFPICMNIQSAVLFYWCTNNFITLGLVVLLKVEAVRAYFGIQKIVPPEMQPIPKKPKKGFIASIKESYEDQKVLSSIDERSRLDEVRFKKAGTGPIPRTYSYDPTKPRPSVSVAAAKASRSSSSNVK